jgi:hypothetical protein
MGDSGAIKHYYSVRYYRAPWHHAGGSHDGIAYFDYDGRIARRQFVVVNDREQTTLVAPYDLEYTVLDPYPGGLPLPGAVEIALAEFEPAWVTHAQPRMRLLGSSGTPPPRDAIRYIRTTLSPGLSWTPRREPGVEYLEAVDGKVRRMFGVFKGRVLVVPFDHAFPMIAGNTPEGQAMLVAQEIAEDLSYGLKPEPWAARMKAAVKAEAHREHAITHAEFEAAWEQYALPRFSELAQEYGY